MERCFYKDVLERIHLKEKNVGLLTDNIIDESSRMVLYIQDLLSELKAYVLIHGFSNENVEINFFKTIKPQILGKLIYYNKVYRIETTCPVSNGKMYYSYFSIQFANLKREYLEHICNTYFYRYYRSGRMDRDHLYFRRGNINYHDGLNSMVFEIDSLFSTFFDYKVARIISNEMLYTYLLTKINPDEDPDRISRNSGLTKDVFWTDSKNALIELVYALYASGAISHGKIGIRKISLMFEILFQISIGEVHHAFHRMKTRAGSRTAFLDQLKSSLEEYMDKEF